MRNKLSDLNNHLFSQLEKLNDDELGGEKLAEEIARTKSMVDISDKIIANATVQLRAVDLVTRFGANSSKVQNLIGE